MDRIRHILPLTLALMVLFAGSVHAQWREQVNRQLEEASQIARDGGLRETEDARTGSLDEDERESQTVSLQAGNQYMMVGACDNDCSDIDFYLYGPGGEQVDYDIEMDDTPVVSVSPSSSGSYRLEVIMVSCSTEPCFYGVGIYGSGGGSTNQGSSGGWQEIVSSQLGNMLETVESSGYRQIEGNRTGSLDEDERESVTLSLQSGTDYMLVGVCDQDCSDLDLRLRDPNGNEVDEDIELDDTPIVSITPSRPGDYSLQVIMVSCSTEPCFYGVGVYGKGGGGAVTASKVDQAANTIRGELRAGDRTISSGEYADGHYIDVRAGQQLSVDLRSSEFDTYLILTKPSGATIDNDDYEGSTSHSHVETIADESGQWTIVVTSYSEGETGSYEVTTSIGGQVAAGGSAPGTRFESGTLASGDQTLSSGEYRDAYAFEGTAGEQVVIDLRSSDFDPYLILRYPSGEQTFNDDHAGDASRSLISLALPETGRYAITVTSYQPGETGAYDLRVEQGSGQIAASGPRSERGSLSPGDETLRTGEYVDYFDFTGRPGQRAHIDLQSNDFDTYLILKDPNGEQQENDDYESTSRSVIDADIVESGTYRVLVTSYSEGETGSYTLAIDLGAGGTTTASTEARDVHTLDFGSTTNGALETGDGRLEDGEYRDTYVFNGSAGETIRVDMNSSAFDTYLGVVAPSGEDVQNDDYEGSTSHSRVEMRLEESGRYRIVATSYEAGQTGQYTLQLQRGGQAAPTQLADRQPRPGPAGEGRVYGIFAGISDYGGRASNLAYTAEDAVRVQNAMVQGGNMRPSDGVLLQDNQVTVGNIRNAVRDFAGRIGPNDTFVFFYSGHGGRIPRDGPQPTDPDALDETLEFYDSGITDDEFRDLMGELNAGKILVFLDACFSGGFSKDVISVPGRMGLFSSEEDVTSSVAAKFRAGGYLAVFLADAIGDGLADADNDGQINAIELSQYIHERYRTDLKSGGPGDFVRTGGPQLGHQHLVVDRGSIGPREILFP